MIFLEHKYLLRKILNNMMELWCASAMIESYSTPEEAHGMTQSSSYSFFICSK
jgi:hypothetical protein